jgi:phosphatidylglycerol:prolipoprotein diacylglycerol transferase
MDSQHQYWVHDLSPFLLQISDNFGIRWYGLAYVAGMVLGGLLIRRWAKQGRAPLLAGDSAKKGPGSAGEVQDFILVTGLAMIIGGRVGYCLFYEFDELLKNPLYLFRVDEGGMSSHGGIIGIFFGVLFFALRRRRSLFVLADLICAAAPIGVIFGRIANFINGELWGRHIQSHVPWAVIFPTELNPPGDIATETARRAWQQANWFLAEPRHPSQLYAAFLEGLVPFLITLPIHARHRNPGLTMGLILVLYCCGRFVDEFFRQPDAGQAIFFGWMSKGQLLTIPLFIIGACIAIWAARKPARPELYLIR